MAVMRRFFFGLTALVCLPCCLSIAYAGADQGREIDAMPGIEPHRARVETVNRNLTERLDDLLPGLMRETGIDLWLVINREYAEDPVYLTLVPEPVFAARRTTMLLFHDRGEEGVQRLTVNRYPIRDYYEPAWEGGDLDDQWNRLGELLAELDPKKIGVNVSRDWPLADGLTESLHGRLMDVLTPALKQRVVSAEDLIIRWMETRSPGELQVYPHIVAVARRVIAEAFSNKVITPGATTTDDVAWYIRERFEALELDPWFQPYVNAQRRGTTYERDAPFFGESGVVIERGDVLHTDVGICYLRLCTDTQEMGYVLRLGESDVPTGLKAALETGNAWQDILTANFVTGRTGNEILARTAEQSEQRDIVQSTYTHPMGFFGHDAGTTIGMWDDQKPEHLRGEWKLHANTGYAIEGNIRQRVAEWDDQWVQIKLEQSAVFDGERVHYLAGRQGSWHVVE